MMGYVVNWPSPIIPKLMDSGQTPLPEVLTFTQASWTGSSSIIGAIIGPYLLGNLVNIIGRKSSIILGSSAVLTATIMVTLAKSYAFLITARVLQGVAISLVAVSDLVYIGEIASSNIRGLILSSTGMFHIFGGLLLYSVGPFVSYYIVGYVFLGINSLHIFACFFIPESPVYYVMKGQETEAKIALKELGRDKDLDKELEDINEIINKDKNNNWKEIFTVKSNWKSLYITTILLIFQESSGMLAISTFAMIIFEKAGSSVEPAIATIIIGVTSFLATPFAPIFIEKFGRRMLLFISTFGVSTFMTILGIFMYLDSIQNLSIESVRWIPLAAMMAACGCYSIGLHCVPNTLIGEFFRPNVRSLGTSISLTIGWSTGLITVASFGYIVEGFGSYVIFFAFAIVNALGFLFVLFVVPETKGLTLPEIEKVFSK